MKWITIITASMILASSFLGRAQSTKEAQSATRPKPAYAISISGPPEPIKLGGAIPVTVNVTNTTQHDIYWQSELGKDSVYHGFTFLLSKNGHEAETTHFHRRISGRQRENDPEEVPGTGSSILLPHPPGKMFEIPIDITRLYNITEQGTYTFHVCRHDEESRTVVCSNDLTLRIEP